MNDWTQLENQLRSWKPRRPSPNVKARLFPQSAPAEPEISWPAVWAWLAPATALVLLAGLVLTKDARALDGWSRGTPTGLVAAAVFDSPTLVTYVSPKRHSSLNAWTGATFEWTNDAASLTTAPPFLQTNGMIQ